MDRAASNGVTHLSITDHDTVDAYGQIEQVPDGMTLIPGIEFSSQWNSTGVHIVGLNIDLDTPALKQAIEAQQQTRIDRAERICKKLQGKGLDVTLGQVQAIAGNSTIGRPHFAQHLIEAGIVKDHAEAFDRYLGRGKAGDVRQEWADMPQVIQWIKQANGIAVLAHPDKYKLTATKLKRLLDEFKKAGGEAMEIVSGRQTRDRTEYLRSLCHSKNLLPSYGSDFHKEQRYFADLGETGANLNECGFLTH